MAGHGAKGGGRGVPDDTGCRAVLCGPAGAGLCRQSLQTHNMKSCSQLGWLPRTAMVVLLTFCTFSVTYVLNFSAVVRAEVSTGAQGPPCTFPSSGQPARIPQGPPQAQHTVLRLCPPAGQPPAHTPPPPQSTREGPGRQGSGTWGA